MMEEGRVMESSSRICQLLMIHMTGGGPFGFRIASIHSDGISPFAVSTIRINGKAYRAGLLEADLVLAINGFSCCSGLSHHSTTKLMEYDDPELTLHILRGENVCEDDIKASLQSLDSQIVELTDNEVQSVIDKKQLQQPVGISVWKSKLTNSLSHQTLSASWLQPPPNTRPKMVERRNDTSSLSQPIEHALTESTPNELTDDPVHQSRTRAKTAANNYMTTMAQPKMSETSESNKDFQLSDKPISELKSKNLDYVSQKYQLNDAEQQSRWIDLPGSVTTDKANDKIISQSKQTTGNFDMASSLNVSNRLIDDRVENIGQTIVLKQQVISNNNHLRNRYRVEQNIVFKPVDQARFYDAESGQFGENSLVKLPKRRSNSISCYHMYIGSGTQAPSSVVENSNRGHFQHPGEFNRWKPNEDNHKIFDGTVYQWANGAIKDPVTDFNQEDSKSASKSNQLPQVSSSHSGNVCMSSSANQSQESYPTVTLSHNVDRSTSHWSSNRPIQSATPTERLKASSSNKWETRSLQQSSILHPFSPAVVDYRPSFRPNSSHSAPISKLVPASMGAVLHEVPPGTSRALPKLISLRSNEDDAHSPSVVHAHFNENLLTKVKPLLHYCDMKSVNYDTHVCSSSKSQVTSTLGFDNNQQLTQPEEIYDPMCNHSVHEPNNSIGHTRPVNATSNSLKTLLADEGKGGRLFARRRANSDAWIVGERDEPYKPAAKSTISDRNIRAMQAMPEPDGMQRRRSLTAGHLQQPVLSETGNNSRQYRSRTAQNLANSFSSPTPFNEMQFTNRPNCHSQISARQSGINQEAWHPLNLNSWQLRGTTSHPISPSISHRFRPLQTDLYHQATEVNRHAVQPNTGYTDL